MSDRQREDWLRRWEGLAADQRAAACRDEPLFMAAEVETPTEDVDGAPLGVDFRPQEHAGEPVGPVFPGWFLDEMCPERNEDQ